MDLLEERFRAKVKRQGDHETWTGALDRRGRGLVRIGGRLRTAQRAAWEFGHGPVPEGGRVLGCPDEPACVRLGHLRLDRATPLPGRRRRHTGTKREVRPGTWELAVGVGLGPSGRARRRFLTVHGDEVLAEAILGDLAATVVPRTSLGDLRVRELLDRYLEWFDEGSDRQVAQLRHLADTEVEPALGRRLALLVTADDIEALLLAQHLGGASDERVGETLRLIRSAYRWTRRQGWTDRNPADDISLRDITSSTSR